MSQLLIEQQITFFYTRDLETTARFYEVTMGLPLSRDQGDCRIYQVSSDGYVGFCQRTGSSQDPVGVIFTIITPDVDGWYAMLNEKGVTFEKPPAENATRYIAA